MAATYEMILTRSPHYINVPFDYTTTTKVNIDIFIWSGDVTSVPTEATIQLEKIRPTVDYDDVNIDIAPHIKDYLDAVPAYQGYLDTVTLVDSYDDTTKWVKYVVSYVDDVETIADLTDTLIASDGYGYYDEGVNPTYNANNSLTDVDNRKVTRDGFIIYPLVNDAVITSVDVDSDGTDLNETVTLTTSNESTEYVQYIWVKCEDVANDNYITITLNPSGETFVYEVTDECRYTPYQILFKNKYGVYEFITMFKKRVDSLEVNKEQFTNNYISSGVYDITKHQIKDINIVAKEKFSLNSGFISEDENELYKQLFLSDRVFVFDSGYKPIRLVSSTQEFKTRNNDKLINYNLDFEYAFNTIQNI